MTLAPDQRVDFDAIRDRQIEWEIDPGYLMWYRASVDGHTLHLRMNARFPDVPLYSLLVDVDETLELETLPPTWKRSEEGDWPESASREFSALEDPWWDDNFGPE